jgi:hypothetical protein
MSVLLKTLTPIFVNIVLHYVYYLSAHTLTLFVGSFQGLFFFYIWLLGFLFFLFFF